MQVQCEFSTSSVRVWYEFRVSSVQVQCKLGTSKFNAREVGMSEFGASELGASSL